MAKHIVKKEPSSQRTPLRPALTPEARENQMIALAMDLVEERLRDGTASAAETTHFLKLATRSERLNEQLAQKDLELKEAKRQAIESQARIEELYSNALAAMRRYSGQSNAEDGRNGNDYTDVY